MPDDAVVAYRLRREADLLRRRLYGSVGDAEGADRAPLIQRLEAVEAELAALVTPSPAAEGTTAAPASTFTLGASAAKIQAEVKLRMDRVPTAMVHLLDAATHPLVTVTVTNGDAAAHRVRVATVVEGYSATSITTLEAKSRSQPNPPVAHLPTFFPAGLDQITELTKATVRVAVTDVDGTLIDEGTFAARLLARTTAVLQVRDPVTGTLTDLSPYLGAWVTPNAPEVMEVLREAAGLAGPPGIVGYQNGAEAVEGQVRAVFDALAARKLTYVNSIISFGAAAGEAIQRVRLPAEALAHKSANCLDGTVLVASLLEAASINPGIALVPGHALLAWETAEDSGEWAYLETTMIGTRPFEEARRFGEAQAEERTPNVLSLARLRADHGITPME